jgi:hypothetical protein
MNDSMGMLSHWIRERRREWDLAKVATHCQQEEQRRLILEWYRLLRPFHTRQRQLEALADDLSKNAMSNIVWWFILFGGGLTVILAILYLVVGWKTVLLIGSLGYIGIIALLFHGIKQDMRSKLKNYAEGYWVAHDPITFKEIYQPMKCPVCDHYVRYLEPCEYCGHEIAWKAAKKS